jgi:hypothetical protein
MVLKIRSIRLISEMKTFVFKMVDLTIWKVTMMILSCAMALWAIEYSFKSLERLEKQTKAMLGSWVAGSLQLLLLILNVEMVLYLLLVKHRCITKTKI